MLTVLDEYTPQALAVAVRTRMGGDDVLDALYPPLLRHDTPEYTGSMQARRRAGLRSFPLMPRSGSICPK